MKNLLVAINFSDLAPEIIANSIELAQALQAKIWLVHVADPNPFFIGYEVEPPVLRAQREEELKRERSELQAMASQIESHGIEVSAELLPGTPVSCIIDKAAEINADMIIIGKEDHGFFYKTFMGSTSEGVVSKSDCPVLVIPLKEED